VAAEAIMKAQRLAHETPHMGAMKDAVARQDAA